MDNITKTLLLAGGLSSSPQDVLTSVSIDSIVGAVYENTQMQLTATGTYTSSSQDVTFLGNWSVIAGGSYGSITPSGLLTINSLSSAVDITIRFTVIYGVSTFIDDLIITANTSNDSNINSTVLLVHA